MNIDIPYAKTHIDIHLPDDNVLDIVKSGDRRQAGEEKSIILKALHNPIGSERLRVLSNHARRAAILVSDVTRPCPSHKFLPFLVDELEEGRVEEINILFGLGIHRKQTEKEKRELVGEYVCRKVTGLLEPDENRFSLLGYTKAGTPIEIFEEALNCDLLIATGGLEYHYFAGYSGGAKAAVPGVCARSTIEANHSMMLHDKARTGVFEGNPLRMDIEDAGQMVGIDFVFNVILDDRKNIIAAVSGKNNEAYLDGIKIYDSLFQRKMNQKADIVITSPGGHPKDLNLYQAQKALDNVKEIVKEDGEIILVAACSEGFGEEVFAEWMDQAKDYDRLSARIQEKFVLGGHKAVAISKVLSKTRVCLYSEFDDGETARMGFQKISNLQVYLDAKISSGKHVDIAVVPSGRFVTCQK